MRVAGFVLFAFMAAVPAQAQTCANTPDVLAKVTAAQSTLERLSRLVEGVAPSDQEFIIAEERSAIDNRNNARFRAIHSHRYYHATKVHVEMRKTITNLTRVRSAIDAKSSSIMAVEALSGYFTLGSALSDYMEADRKRDQPILSQTDREDLYLLIQFARHDLTTMVRCSIEALQVR